MDELVQRCIREAESKKRTSVPWGFDEPWTQPYYIHSPAQNKWNATDANNKSSQSMLGILKIALYSWNIDFMLPYPDSRMTVAIRHLESLMQNHPNETATVIYVQECLESDLKVVASDPWIQRTFALTDINIDNWQSGHYGTCTLIDRRLPITECFRVHYSQTRMERDVLCVDTVLGNENEAIRLCNTHLESLALEPPYRPPQVELTAKYMHDPAIAGAIVAGDFNAIQDFDRALHSANGLKDAYLELGGSENDAKRGHTWGQQAATVQRDRFGTSRMDKVFFCGGVRCVAFERFGDGVELENESEKQELVKLGFDRPWITDHLGVMAVLEIQDRAGDSQSSD